MTTSFHFQSPIYLKDRILLKRFLSSLIKKEKAKIDELNIIFCSDRYLLDINRTYLKHDYFTDIITFEIPNNSKKTVELYISTHRIKQNSTDYQCSIKNELHRVIFHGLLHICGYRDKTAQEKTMMTNKENYYLHKYFNKK